MLGAGHRQSLFFRGLLGYFIGIETALGMYTFLIFMFMCNHILTLLKNYLIASFVLGKNIARYM